MAVFKFYNWLETFKIEEVVLKKFCKGLDNGYLPNPYHNSAHAADVLHSLNYILHFVGLGKSLTDEQMLAAHIAAAVHDFKHPGLNNNYLMKTRRELAIT